ncbi:MAG TPA: alpha-L-arabinofuranosidase C-terminal domain-containing protein [Bryobacteraceae bacterium]|nr:alpha-L-arabinofuranosidase C-terminal domain-containing protein [Bryobacteraceae bacterium]
MHRAPVYRLAVAASLLAACAVAQEAPAVLRIQGDKPAAKVSPTLYGLMTEEINFSYEGGLYAELIQNNTFRGDWSGVLHWYLVEKGNANAKMADDHQSGPSEALKTSLRLEVSQADEHNPAGVLNDGYWGIPVRPNTTYHGSLYARTDSASPSPLTVELVNDDTGDADATATVPGIGTSWAQHVFTLKTAAAVVSTHHHLEILTTHPGTLWLQLVSLFPPTYHNRTNGFRTDLMEKLAAMHPAFLRFPGGNYLEGDHIKDRFEWKKTIGPLADRPGHPSPWGYFSTDGMGLLEFLDWCEDLKMEPVLAVYAGYSLAQEHVDPGPALEPYVNDALDELEYVSGSAATKWGAVRASNGHPEPFRLHYVEIGNEDQFDRSGSYEGRYAQFYKAIKAKYPDLELIATEPIKNMRPDVIDDHYYRRAKEFFEDAGHYDKTDRSGPKIFVGEWATREGTPTPNFGAALGDAAWMTGMERNSDIVVMASYAPLLVNVNPKGTQWESDLIGYDALRSYGSPSYYAQVMFGSYLGDVTLDAKLDSAVPKLFYSVTRNTAKKQIYVKLVNASSVPKAIDIDLAGAKLAGNAKLVSLSAKDTQTTNTIDQPTRIIPAESTIRTDGDKLHHSMPGYSIQVIALNLK